MDELGLFTAALGLSGPWRVMRSEFDAEACGCRKARFRVDELRRR